MGLQDSTCNTVASGVAGSSAAPLGNTAKSYSAFRAERFALQSIARALLPAQRVRHCLRSRRKDQNGVTVWKCESHNKTAHFQGLQTCASVWHCPVCAAKISERRRAELSAAIAVHMARGGVVLLLTLTNAHNLGDDLSELLQGQEKALKRFRGDRSSVRLLDEFGVVGTVRALEVTFGQNGWHPHYHVLLFLSGAPAGCVSAWRDRFALRWLECCRAAGLPLPDLAHGVDLRGGQWAAKYAAKWGVEQEMTRGHTKRARKGMTPWDLLRAAQETGEFEVARRFQEYAACFKGKRQLFWSRGLKASLSIEEVSDEELVEVVEESAVLLGRIDADEWRAILRFDLRANVLEAAERGWDAVAELLCHARSMVLESRGVMQWDSV